MQLTTKEKQDVMQAHENGQPVQAQGVDYHGDEWFDAIVPLWNWERLNYRVKPCPRDPRRCYVVNFPEHGRDREWTVAYAYAYSCDAPPRDGGERVQMIELTVDVVKALRVAQISYEGSRYE
tara:strand:+ start:33891 stop:34256 length:366 start_codon:yes stop_codon:yes gene_type:complete